MEAELRRDVTRVVHDYEARLQVCLAREQLLNSKENEILLARGDPQLLQQLRGLLDQDKRLLSSLQSEYADIIKNARIALDELQKLGGNERHGVGGQRIKTKELREFFMKYCGFLERIMGSTARMQARVDLEEAFLKNPTKSNLEGFLAAWKSEVDETNNMANAFTQLLAENERKGARLWQRLKATALATVGPYVPGLLAMDMNTMVMTNGARFPPGSTPWIVANIVGILIGAVFMGGAVREFMRTNKFYIAEVKTDRKEIREIHESLRRVPQLAAA